MSNAATFAYVPLHRLLRPDPDQRDRTTRQYRQYLDDELRPDVRRRGVVVPLLVYPRGDRYQVFDGGTRLEAGLLEGLETVPCLVYPAMPSQAELEIATFLANEKRLDLSPKDKGRFYLSVMREKGWTQTQLCRELSLNAATVSKRLKWLERLRADLQEKVGEGDGLIPERAAYALADFPAERQADLAAKLTAGLMTVEALEGLKRNEKGRGQKKPRPVTARTARGLTVTFAGLGYEALIAELSALIEAAKRGMRNGIPESGLSSLLKAAN